MIDHIHFIFEFSFMILKLSTLKRFIINKNVLILNMKKKSHEKPIKIIRLLGKILSNFRINCLNHVLSYYFNCSSRSRRP